MNTIDVIGFVLPFIILTAWVVIDYITGKHK